MTPRRAAAIGAAAGILPGLYLGIRAAQAWLLVHWAERGMRRLTRALRNDRWRADRYRLDVEQLQQDGAQEPDGFTRRTLAGHGIPYDHPLYPLAAEAVGREDWVELERIGREVAIAADAAWRRKEQP